MSSFTLPNTPFPTGTSVSAYDAQGYSTFPAVPPGNPIATATVTGGSLNFTGLTDGHSYFAAAKVGEVWKGITFHVGADGPPPGIPEDISYVGVGPRKMLSVTEDGASFEFVDRTIIDSDDWDSPQDAIGRADEKGGALVQLPASTSPVDLASPLLVPNYCHLLGQGIRTTLRCTSSNYAVKFEGAHCSAKHFRVEAQTKQSGGGAFDYTKAGGNIKLEDIIFGHRLKTGVLLAPEKAGAVYRLIDLRWDGVLESGLAIQLGDGTHLITDIYFDKITGTGNSAEDMLEWLKVNSAVDTLKGNDSTFITGGAGYVGNGHPTNVKLHKVTMDGIAGIAWNFTGGGWEIECNGCEGTSQGEILNVGKEMRIFRWLGGAMQNGQANGAIIRNGSQDVTIAGASISDNNQSNGGNNHGVFVEAGASHFKLLYNTIGNGRRVTEAGHQKRPVFVEKGASDHYVIVHNDFVGNDITKMLDEGEGTHKIVEPNLES